MSDNSTKIGEIINRIITEKSEGNPAIAEMTKAKLILKGIHTDKYYNDPINDHPDILERLIEISQEWNAETPKVGDDVFLTVCSQMATEDEVALDIQSQLKLMEIKVLVYFASSSFNRDRLSHLMEKAFSGSVVFGCSTAGERINEKFLTGSVVALALSPKLIADAKVKLLHNISSELNIKGAFKSFDNHFLESTYNMDTSKYVGIILSDGTSSKEEMIMDGVGNLTNISFIGASAGDDLKFEKTYIYADGKAYTDAAIVVLLKMQDNAKCSILLTQSFNPLEQKLTANKVDVDARDVIEFNNKPATQAYAEAIGIDNVDQLPQHFFSHPVGLVIDEDNILVRSPVSVNGSSIRFSSSILKDMEVFLLERADLIERTKSAIDRRLQDVKGKIAGILVFDSVFRKMELERKNLIKQYGEIFSTIPTGGFNSYGEANIGHMNQTATMLFFEYDIDSPGTHGRDILSGSSVDKGRLSQINRDLERENMELRRKLDTTASELKRFNVSLVEEINYRTEREEKIRQLSYHDELTNLYNRRYFSEHVSKLDVEANLPLSVIYCDVDNLKRTNDTFGHDRGDELLKKAATAIRNSCRESDIIVRLGGDEFLIVLPQTPNDVAAKIENRICNNALSQLVNNVPISISFGLDTKEHMTQDIKKAIMNAETMMYQRKALHKKGDVSLP